MDQLIQQNNFDSYKNQDRKSIEESLVSLRFMKQIDNYCRYQKLTNRDLAHRLQCSESYISQLMTGSKKINISFINKFEKNFEVKMEVAIKDKNTGNFFKFNNDSFNIKINIEIDMTINIDDVFKQKFYNDIYSDFNFSELSTD